MESIRNYINEKNVLKDDIYKSIENSITCMICLDIIIEPMICMSCHHSFCNNCINKWLKIDHKCPNRCKILNYQNDLELNKLLSKLKFGCEKCKKVINYDEMMKHFLSKCQLGNNKIEGSITETSFQKIDNSSLSREPETKLTSKIIIF